MKITRLFIIFVVAFQLFAADVASQLRGNNFPAEIELQAQEIYKRLRCVVCAGQPLSESEADIAIQMRTIIKEFLSQGKTENEVISWLRQRYGDDILNIPEFNSLSWPLYIFPAIILLIVILVVPFYIWRRIKKE